MDRELFNDSRMEELSELTRMGCFQVVNSKESEGFRIFRLMFVDEEKADGSKRSRLCVAACNDQKHGLFTAAPTVERIYKFNLCKRDVIKVFVNSKTYLRRKVYMRAPSEMKLPRKIAECS